MCRPEWDCDRFSKLLTNELDAVPQDNIPKWIIKKDSVGRRLHQGKPVRVHTNLRLGSQQTLCIWALARRL